MKSVRLIIWCKDGARIDSIFEVPQDKFFRKNGDLTKKAARELRMAYENNNVVTMEYGAKK